MESFDVADLQIKLLSGLEALQSDQLFGLEESHGTVTSRPGRVYPLY